MLESSKRDAGDGAAGKSANAPMRPDYAHPALTIGAIALGVVVHGVAVDLVLPAVPMLPAILGGTTEMPSTCLPPMSPAPPSG